MLDLNMVFPGNPPTFEMRSIQTAHKADILHNLQPFIPLISQLSEGVYNNPREHIQHQDYNHNEEQEVEGHPLIETLIILSSLEYAFPDPSSGPDPNKTGRHPAVV